MIRMTKLAAASALSVATLATGTIVHASGAEPAPPTSAAEQTEAVEDQAASVPVAPFDGRPLDPCDPANLADDLARPVSIVDGLCHDGWALVSTGELGDSTMLVAVMGARWGIVTGYPSTMCPADLEAVGAPVDIVNASGYGCDGTTPVEPELAPGSVYGPVARLQQELIDRGYPLERTDSYDEATTAAVTSFQTDIGLDPDGRTGPNTRAALGIGLQGVMGFPTELEFMSALEAFLNLGDTGNFGTLPADVVTALQSAGIVSAGGAPYTLGDPLRIPQNRVVIAVTGASGAGFGACVTPTVPMNWCGLWDLASVPAPVDGTEAVDDSGTTPTLAPGGTEAVTDATIGGGDPTGTQESEAVTDGTIGGGDPTGTQESEGVTDGTVPRAEGVDYLAMDPCDPGVISEDLGQPVTVRNGQCLYGWAVVTTVGENGTSMLVALMGLRWGIVEALPSARCADVILLSGAPREVFAEGDYSCTDESEPPTELGPGAVGGQVGRLQQELIDRGYQVTVTHEYDAATEAAVRQAQTDLGLAVDGLTGPDTMNALGIATKPATEYTDPYQFLEDVVTFANGVIDPAFDDPDIVAAVTLASGGFDPNNLYQAGDLLDVTPGRVVVPLQRQDGSQFGACITPVPPMRWCGLWDTSDIPFVMTINGG